MSYNNKMILIIENEKLNEILIKHKFIGIKTFERYFFFLYFFFIIQRLWRTLQIEINNTISKHKKYL